jgi:hypothetical protein
VEDLALILAVRKCFETLRVRHGWGIAEAAQHLGVHYETARRLRAGEIKAPSFMLVADLHRLAQHSLDDWLGITDRPAGAVDGSGPTEDSIREMVLDQLGIILTRGLTIGRASKSEAEMPAQGSSPGDADTAPSASPASQTEEALLTAGRALALEGQQPDSEPPLSEQIKRRKRTGNGKVA